MKSDREYLEEELGLEPGARLEVWHGFTFEQVRRIMGRVRADMKEEAAKVAEEFYADESPDVYLEASADIATAIRALEPKS